MNNISEHITYKEATKSITAIRNGIDNTPNDTQLFNMTITAEQLFELLREKLGNYALPLSSFFRSKILNKRIGGSKNSQHLEGRSIDVDCDIISNKYYTNREVFFALLDMDFDQLIAEGIDEEGKISWVHSSYVSPCENRKEVLVMARINGKTRYKPYRCEEDLIINNF